MKKAFSIALLFIAAIACAAETNPYEEIYKHYFALGNALANDSLDGAKKSANDLKNSIAKVQEAKPVEVATEKEKFNEQLETVSNLANLISGAKSVPSTHKPYAEMSGLMVGMMPYTRVSGVEYFCPMVNKSWLQKDDKKVMNPYGGKAMQQCGEKKK